jgi:hypothetical protein
LLILHGGKAIGKGESEGKFEKSFESSRCGKVALLIKGTYPRNVLPCGREGEVIESHVPHG